MVALITPRTPLIVLYAQRIVFLEGKKPHKFSLPTTMLASERTFSQNQWKITSSTYSRDKQNP